MFTTASDFLHRRDAGFFLEWDQPHGEHFYGIPCEPALGLLARHATLIREVGVTDLRQLRAGAAAEYLRAIFLRPVDLSDLERRLVARGDELRTARLKHAERELAGAADCDYTVVVKHGAIDEALKRMEGILGE